MGTYEGYGAGATGGSTSQVVTNLNDSGAGSLRAACATSTPLITFAVEGWIFLESTLSISANTTIDGSTAPGNGITLSIRKDLIGTPWHVARIEGSNVILTGIRCRHFIPDAGHGPGDALNIQLASGVTTVMIDQCSLGWGDDECMDFGGCTDATIQWSIVHQALQTPGTSLGLLIPGGSSANRISVHHNLMALHHGRCLGRNASNGTAQFVCNICYGPVDHPATVDNSSNTDFIKNYYKKSPTSNRNYLVDGQSAGSTVYHSGNACNNCTGFTVMSAGSLSTISGTPLASPSTPVTEEASAAAAAAAVIANAGCYASDGNLDTFDLQVIDQYNLGIGGIIEDPETDIGGVCRLPY